MSGTPFHISSLTMVLFELSALLDTGKCDIITVGEVKKHAAKGDLIEFLKEEAGSNFDTSLIEVDAEFKRWYVDRVRGLSEAIDERRKYGIANKGLCLLISYTAEIIQQGQDIRMGHTA